MCVVRSFESIGLGSRNCLNSIAKISARRLATFYYPDPEEHNQTRYGTVTIPNYALAAYAGCRLAVDVEYCFICDCFVVCVNLGPKAVISVILVQQFIFILVFIQFSVNHFYFYSVLVLSTFIHFSSYSVLVLLNVSRSSSRSRERIADLFRSRFRSRSRK